MTHSSAASIPVHSDSGLRLPVSHVSASRVPAAPAAAARRVRARRKRLSYNAEFYGFALLTFAVLVALLFAATVRAQSTTAAPPAVGQPSASPFTEPAPSSGMRKLGAGVASAITGETRQDPAKASLYDYLRRVRADYSEAQPSSGSIWSEGGRFTRMSTDVRAMQPHDLISVVVAESLSSSTDGTVKNTRASNASSGISGLIGTLHAGNALQNLVNQNSSSGLNATGTSQSNSSLNTTLGGEVVDVLPNGMLVIQAARQVEFNQQTQTIVLRGLVRPEDISQQNQIVSTAISSLELEVKGKGIINDYTHRQSALVRILQRLLVF